MIKIIWTYWHQGIDNAPPVVKPCVDKWRSLNPDWELILIDKDNIYEYIDPIDIDNETLDKMSLAISSDLFKLKFLIHYGGVWVDATSYPLIPLNEWLLDKMDAKYFFFYKPGRDRLISSWFIAAEKNNEMFVYYYKALINYWKNNSFRNIGQPWVPYMKWLYKLTNQNIYLTKLWFSFFYTKILRVTPYLVTHYMFYYIINKNREFNLSFKQMPKYSANKVHLLKKEDYYKDLNKSIKKCIDKKEIPVLKLNWRFVKMNIPKSSNLDYLFKN